MKKKIILDGAHLTVAEILTLTRRPAAQVALANQALVKIRKNHNFARQHFQGQVIYGVNTGFGPMASHILGHHQLLELQENLVRSHAVGMGKSIDPAYVLAAMVVRLNTLAKGYSGVSPALLKRLALFINHRIIPIIPEHGAVGTSGDLVQLSHIALALIGEGQVLYQDRQRQTSAVLKSLKIAPYTLQPKEGLGLINGTSVMAGISSLLVSQAERLLALSLQLGALSLELVNAYDDSIAKDLHETRPHPGQLTAAAYVRNTLSSSKLLRNRAQHTNQYKLTEQIQELPQAIQEVYSLRCIAQIIGPIIEIYQRTMKVTQIEINSVTDNPIVMEEHNAFFHGGNFHGDYIASAIDYLKAGLVKLTLLSERRTNYFLNRNINKRFPPFLNLAKPGLTLGLQGLQFVATSTAAQSQSLAFPHHLHSIPTNGDNQDVVSMGTDASLLASKVIDNAFIVLTIELITLAQAVDAIQVQSRLSATTKRLYQSARAVIPTITEDKVLFPALGRLLETTQHELELTL